MNNFHCLLSPGLILAAIGFSAWAQPTAPAIKEITLLGPAPQLTIQSEVGTTNVIEFANQLATNQWQALTNLVVTDNPYVFVDLSALPAPQRFYRVLLPAMTNVPPDTNVTAAMALIPAGSFTMGDSIGDGQSDEIPTHTVMVSAFYMDTNLVSKALWDEVFDWAMSVGGYSFDSEGLGKAASHPVQTVTWFDALKWCNARSEKAGLTAVYYSDATMSQVVRGGQLIPYVKWDAKGYRLPTEAEWEKAGRGGLTGKRFPWGNTISHSQANYFSSSDYSYDVSPTRGFHPDYAVEPWPYTSPVGSFAPNGYGLYDMAGNVWEWCWDWDGPYGSSSQTDPRGADSGTWRIIRGGCWYDAGLGWNCRVSDRFSEWPVAGASYFIGFRTVMTATP
jgi:formylglycine-generating enzyme